MLMEGKFGRAVTVWLRPLKKKKAAAKVPVMFEEGDGGSDDVYAFLKALFRHDCHREAEAGCTPMFRERGRQAVHPKDFTAEVKQAAVRAGRELEGAEHTWKSEEPGTHHAPQVPIGG